MKRFTDYISPVGNLLILPFLITTTLLFFSPSLNEWLLAMGIDFIAYLIFAPLGNFVFVRLYPDTAIYFRGIDNPQIKNLNENEKLQLLKSLIDFPLKRSIFFCVLDFIKITPAALIIIFCWQHSCSNLEQLFKFLIWEIPVVIFVAGETFIEFHIFVTQKIKELNKSINLQKIFESTNFNTSAQLFSKYESIAFLSLCFTLMVTISFTIFHSSNVEYFKILLIALVIFGQTLVARLYFLNRNFIANGLQDILNQFKTFDASNISKPIPLSSSQSLATVATVFNELSMKLRKNERELSKWIVKEVEDSRFKTVGEITSMVIHDLKSPLATIDFCIDELKENKEKINDPRIIEHLSTNSQKSLELIKSLMAYLKNPSLDEKESVYDSFLYVKKVTSTQYPTEKFNLITFEIDSELKNIFLKISRVDLIHILNNLIQNSVRNLINNNVALPVISLRLEKNRIDGKLNIIYSDSGTGLKKDEFERLTAFGHLQVGDETIQGQGLGLRLTRRLVERNYGYLNFIEGENGTTYQLILKERAEKAQYHSTFLQ